MPNLGDSVALYPSSFTDPGGGTEIAVRLRLGVAVVVAALASARSAGTARAGTALIVTGHGWGHGVGMSQWGAYGYALHGWKYHRILSHYYPGTKLGRVGETRVRVLLAQGANVATVGCATPMRVTDGKRLTRKLPAGTYGDRAAAVAAGAAPRNRPLLREPRRARLRPRAAHVRRARVPRDARSPQQRPRRLRRQRRSRSTPTSAASFRPSRRRTGRSPRSRRRRSPRARTPSPSCGRAPGTTSCRPRADQVYGGVGRREAELRQRRVRDARPGR